MSSPPRPPAPIADSDITLLAQHLAPTIKPIIAAELRESGRIIADEVLTRLLEYWDERKKEEDERKAEEKRREEVRRAAEEHKEKARKVGAEKGGDWRRTVPFRDDDVEFGVKTGVVVGGRKTGSTYRSGGAGGSIGEVGQCEDGDDDEDVVGIIDSYKKRD
jgi:hypothetical protein